MSADELARLTLALCQVPSVTGDEAALCSRIADHLAAHAPWVAVERAGNALLCRGPRRPGRPRVGLFGHLDTVRPAADQDLGLREGRVYGCGASDMKGGLAVMLALLAESRELAGEDLDCVFYDKEEGPAEESGILPLLPRIAALGLDLALCLEPTDNAIHAGCLGGLHAQVTFAGQRAHSARPWQGRNAIYAALPYLRDLAARERREVHVQGLPFYEVMSATQAHTENSRNVVPDRFTINVNHRFAPDKDLGQAEAELRASIPADAEVRITDRAPPGRVCLDHPLLQRWQRRLDLPVAAKQAWTDVARLSALGLAALNFGPGETAQAHQAQESVPVAHLAAHLVALRELF